MPFDLKPSLEVGILPDGSVRVKKGLGTEILIAANSPEAALYRACFGPLGEPEGDSEEAERVVTQRIAKIDMEKRIITYE